jgi:uncharacterized protein YecE (DUF72 family)
VRVRVGCTSWSYDDWVGAFYPPKTPSTEFLARYSKVFGLVEGDATFYRIPKLDVTARWASETPADFWFTTKFSRRITHEARLQGVEEVTKVFLERMEPLRKAGKLAAILAQFPPSLKAEKAAHLLGPFLDLVPRGTRVACEFRNPTWFTSETYKVLRDRGASLVWQVTPEGPSPAEVTADFLYVRLIGPDRALERFDHVQRDLRPKMDALRAALNKAEGLQDVLVLASNHFEGHGPATAARVSDALGLPEPDLALAKAPVGAQRGLGDFG